MTRSDVYSYLSKYKLGVVSTVNASGMPESALVGVAATPELELVFDTVKSTRKYPNLIADPRCSFVIGWSGEQTVQYEGRAHELAAPELARYQEIYFRAFPDGPSRLSWTGIVYFVVRPLWIRYSDFARTPPLIEEFTF
mgnify:CR=1 FL=1